ncbi:MAG: proprotein convertase P-domain-containing protein, partial [Thermoguttaceae bacterium]
MFFSDLFTGLGRRSSRRTPHSGSASRGSLSPRRLRCEPLEERQLLSVVTYTNDPNPNQPIPDKGTITSAITVQDSCYAADVNVTVNMSHTRDEDLDVFLIAPDGTRVELFTDVGGTGDHFNGTTLDDAATAAITAGTAPFSGTYRPEGDLTTVERKSVQGTWKLEVTDDTKRETGTLNSWSLTVTEATGTSTNFLDTNPEMLGNIGFANDVAASENGDAMAIWLESKGTGDTGPWMTMAARYDAAAGTWGPTAMISEPTLTTVGYNWKWCRLAGDGQGNYLAVWQQSTAGEEASQRGSIWVNRYVAESGWQTPQTIETDTYPAYSFSPVVAMAYDPTTQVSKAVVAWEYRSADFIAADLKVSRLMDFAANTWSGPISAENLPIELRDASTKIGMATNGDFLLTLQASAAPYDLYYRHYQWSTQDWSGPENAVELRAESVTDPDMAMNHTG